MKKEFLVERQGKTFVLYAGLLDVAHSMGLVSIGTELIQVPEDTNGGIAIVSAVATLAGPEGQIRSFAGIGDAAPNNVAPPMRTALIRMAETRAKARALRDAINVGATAFEELAPDEEDGQSAPPRRTAPAEPKRQDKDRKPVSVTGWLDWIGDSPKDGKMAEPVDTAAFETWCLDWDSVIDRSGASTSVVNWITNGAGWKTLTAYQLKALKLTLTSDRFTQADREQIQSSAQVYAEHVSEKPSAPETFKAEINEVPF